MPYPRCDRTIYFMQMQENKEFPFHKDRLQSVQVTQNELNSLHIKLHVSHQSQHIIAYGLYRKQVQASPPVQNTSEYAAFLIRYSATCVFTMPKGKKDPHLKLNYSGALRGTS